MGPKSSQHLVLPATKPYKSSNLAIPVSPFSPRLPITPPATPPKVLEFPALGNLAYRDRAHPPRDYPAPPQQPLVWLWQCHVCNRCYQLGVTRRCLDDGHYFCAGTTVIKRGRRGPNAGKKVVRHKACLSEFDYQGWKNWGNWRRGIAVVREQDEMAMARKEKGLELVKRGEEVVMFTPEGLEEGEWLRGDWRNGGPVNARIRSGRDGGKDCWNRCDYPSECRWGRQYGIRTPSPEAKKTATTSVTMPSLVLPAAEQPTLDGTPMYLDKSLPPVPEEAVEHSKEVSLTSADEEAKRPSMDDLLESAKRRKRRSSGMTPSPLASNPSSLVSGEGSHGATAQALQKAFDDFEVDFRRSFGGFMSNLVARRCSPEADRDGKGQVRRKGSSASMD